METSGDAAIFLSRAKNTPFVLECIVFRLASVEAQLGTLRGSYSFSLCEHGVHVSLSLPSCTPTPFQYLLVDDAYDTSFSLVASMSSPHPPRSRRRAAVNPAIFPRTVTVTSDISLFQAVDKKPSIPESEILTTGTEDEEASSAPERVSVQKNLRFFGDTDQESVSSNRDRR